MNGLNSKLPEHISVLSSHLTHSQFQRKDKGQVLLDKVMFEIDLQEHEYFGLCWRDKNGLRVSLFDDINLKSFYRSGRFLA